MTVGVLLITHNRIGAELLETATTMLGRCPLAAIAIEVHEHDDPDALRAEILKCAERLDDGGGLLVLTDLYGSTPANVTDALHRRGHVQVLSGVNLPMLVRVLNYHQLDLGSLAEKALSGGRDGVLGCPDA
ncbi:PTS sugar transporter subunit IIA [Halochromatium glycolicum]|jgi:PTS system ascorbate-specific IIA component|uniref:PTS fructose transporter subunit IIA n=1 Tax=Halochromatium glycolicum TaxID=85075 RepID=A0AAJ0XC15_9GAMM|nr:PTS fructose transporter subunit IIA [Halochromatium glycolicum]MBK1706760.1 PTS fructose transporter subunit IIA [Halochromatium glycolicum]NBC47121.1 PTS fructose transporter subunit IIA [Gammaproteobacteria bacterium]